MLKRHCSTTTSSYPRSTLAYVAASLLASSLVSPVALAQETDLALEEIIVTARYRSENLQEVPLSVTAFTETQINDARIDQVGDFLDLTANVTFVPEADFGGSFITIRGISQVRNVESPVAVVVDGVQQIHPSQFTQELFDIQSIAVLRGPQGALYGRNASGGAILITQKKPTNDLEGKVGLRSGKNGEFQVQGSVSGAIVEDKWFFRAGVRYRELDGYLKNLAVGKYADPLEDTTFRGALIYQGEKLDLALTTTLSKFEGGANNFVYQGILFDPARPGEFFQIPGFYDEPIDFNTGSPNIDADDTSIPLAANNIGFADRNVREVSLKIDYAFDAVTLTSVTASSVFDSHQTQDGFPYTASIDPLETGASNYLDVNGFSQEIRLASNTDSAVRWMVGAYYLKTDRFIAVSQNQDLGQGIPLVERTPPGPTSIGPNVTWTADDNENVATAYFGNVDWDVTEDLELSFAYRYDRDERDQFVSPFQTDDNAGSVNSATFSEGQPKFSAKWSVNESVNLYASWGKGFRSGQFNQAGLRERGLAVGLVGLLDQINPEVTESIEFGVKSDLMGGRVRLNAAVFQNDVEGFFYFAFIPQTGDDALINIDDVRLIGGEIELTASVTENFGVYASLGITDSEIKRYTTDPSTIGNRAPYVAKSTFNLGGQHRFDITPDLNWFTRVDFERRGEQFWDPENTSSRSPINFLTVRAGLEGSDKWSLIGTVNNLLDEKFNSEYVGGQFPGIAHPGLPQIWSVDFYYNW